MVIDEHDSRTIMAPGSNKQSSMTKSCTKQQFKKIGRMETAVNAPLEENLRSISPNSTQEQSKSFIEERNGKMDAESYADEHHLRSSSILNKATISTISDCTDHVEDITSPDSGYDLDNNLSSEQQDDGEYCDHEIINHKIGGTHDRALSTLYINKSIGEASTCTPQTNSNKDENITKTVNPDCIYESVNIEKGFTTDEEGGIIKEPPTKEEAALISKKPADFRKYEIVDDSKNDLIDAALEPFGKENILDLPDVNDTIIPKTCTKAANKKLKIVDELHIEELTFKEKAGREYAPKAELKQNRDVNGNDFLNNIVTICEDKAKVGENVNLNDNLESNTSNIKALNSTADGVDPRKDPRENNTHLSDNNTAKHKSDTDIYSNTDKIETQSDSDSKTGGEGGNTLNKNIVQEHCTKENYSGKIEHVKTVVWSLDNRDINEAENFVDKTETAKQLITNKNQAIIIMDSNGKKPLNPDNSDNAEDNFLNDKYNNKASMKNVSLENQAKNDSNEVSSEGSNLSQEAKSTQLQVKELLTTGADRNADDNDESIKEILKMADNEVETLVNTSTIKDNLKLIYNRESVTSPSCLHVQTDINSIINKANDSKCEMFTSEEKTFELTESSDKTCLDESPEPLNLNNGNFQPETQRKLKRSNEFAEDEDGNILKKTKVQRAAKCKINKQNERIRESNNMSNETEVQSGSDNTVKVNENGNDTSIKMKDIPTLSYPVPNLDGIYAKDGNFRMDFLKRFHKSFDTLTKKDLEELVLQKVIEAIVYKSEFGEMRDLIIKQEKIIADCNVKISELNRQFRELEIVHNRVIRDIEARNSQYVMPVKITRAVGLQVCMLNKRIPNGGEQANAKCLPTSTGVMNGQHISSTSNNHINKQSATNTLQTPPAMSPASTGSRSNTANFNHDLVMENSTSTNEDSSQSALPRNSVRPQAIVTPPMSVASTSNRRIIGQKNSSPRQTSANTNQTALAVLQMQNKSDSSSIPYHSTGGFHSLNTSNTSSVATLSTLTPVTLTRMLNKNIPSSSANHIQSHHHNLTYSGQHISSGNGTPSIFSKSQMKVHQHESTPSVVPSVVQQMNQQYTSNWQNSGCGTSPVMQTQNYHQRNQQHNTGVSKSSASSVNNALQRSEPSTLLSIANSHSCGDGTLLENYINTLNQMPNSSLSITPTKSKDKAIIDLTDDDEIMPVHMNTHFSKNLIDTESQIEQQQQEASSIFQSSSTTSSSMWNSNVSVNQRRILPSSAMSVISNQCSSHMHFATARTATPTIVRASISTAQLTSNKVRQAQPSQNKNLGYTTSSSHNNSCGNISLLPFTSAAVSSPSSQNILYSQLQGNGLRSSGPPPLPEAPFQAFNASWKLPPPKPIIRINNMDNGIVISWTVEEPQDMFEETVSYQIYAYQEPCSGPIIMDSWRLVGDVKAMLLPMAVTLTQFQEDKRYYFAVRAVDCHKRYGPFSVAKTWN